MTRKTLRGLAAALGFVAVAAWADGAGNETELRAAFEAAHQAKVVGPARIALRDQAMLELPQGLVYVPTPAATQLMRAIGNRADDRLVGLVVPETDEPWFVAIKFVGDGFVRDDEAREWKAEDLLQSLRAGTEAANAERVRRGFAPIEVVGWAEPPRYDSGRHRLVWSAASREKGNHAPGEQGVNYNTYALGREGFISLNLITDLDKLGRFRPFAQDLLAALEFNPGKRYVDFDASTDRVAAYGLATLIAGAAAKKLGFFATLLAFAAKFSKLIAVMACAALWAAVKLAGRRKALRA